MELIPTRHGSRFRLTSRSSPRGRRHPGTPFTDSQPDNMKTQTDTHKPKWPRNVLIEHHHRSAYNCGNPLLKEMLMSTSVRIDDTLVEQARSAAKAEFRTVQGQIEFWAKVGRAALDNPDLPASFIAESLMAMAEPREESTPFTPRSNKK